ncbi:unnamed protein product [Paramecium octaurelia]|uniref:Uncharacterized protein n=1 Tax=Paramecium octaurelia TaxID=43137 RepID=A0A8S1V2R3_PAROT|nr:unnamed protein product [Paramecium octaurelia]
MSQNKIIMLGDCGVGKTTILNNFLDINAKTETTIGVQHHSFTRNYVKFSIWDTAGQEKYRSIVSSHYKRAKAAILVYDCSSESSLLHIDKWIEELVFQAGANVKIALIGNKTDLQNFDINEHTQKLTEQYEISYQIQTNHKDPEFKDKMNQLLDQISIGIESILFLYLGLIPPILEPDDQVNVIELNHKEAKPIEVQVNNSEQEVKTCEC